jgi:tRNA A-37 threonylcarbamoyl transferase component Bud32
VGVLDRWLKKFLAEPDDDVPVPAPEPARAADAGDAGDPRVVDAPARPDPHEETLVRVRARLTIGAQGRAYAESADFLHELSSLDAGGRGKAADNLLADALLVTPSVALRRRLAERLLHRGDRARAKKLLEKLAEDANPDHAAFALTALGEAAEADGDTDAALSYYERVLAQDMSLAQPKARARRLRQGSDEKRTDDGRRVLARFLGARAAGSRYAVVDELGRGGAATVFRARDRVIGREVALKIFHARGSAQERRARLVQEARVAGRFDHPHIVPILDLDETRDLLVMALCDGGSLQKRIAQGRLRASDAVEVGAVLLRTLADIHDAGQLHLDVKPSNLLFHEGLLMLCDFGTAGMREMGAVAGTRAYMAPEQKMSGEASAAADLYAAGLVVVEAIEGRLPSQPVLTALPAGPRRRALERVLAQLCAADPKDRWRDGREAAQALLEAGAMPLSDKEGDALFHHIESLAAREGEAAQERMKRHMLVETLRSP